MLSCCALRMCNVSSRCNANARSGRPAFSCACTSAKSVSRNEGLTARAFSKRRHPSRKPNIAQARIHLDKPFGTSCGNVCAHRLRPWRQLLCDLRSLRGLSNSPQSKQQARVGSLREHPSQHFSRIVRCVPESNRVSNSLQALLVLLHVHAVERNVPKRDGLERQRETANPVARLCCALSAVSCISVQRSFIERGA